MICVRSDKTVCILVILFKFIFYIILEADKDWDVYLKHLEHMNVHK